MEINYFQDFRRMLHPIDTIKEEDFGTYLGATLKTVLKTPFVVIPTTLVVGSILFNWAAGKPAEEIGNRTIRTAVKYYACITFGVVDLTEWTAKKVIEETPHAVQAAGKFLKGVGAGGVDEIRNQIREKAMEGQERVLFQSQGPDVIYPRTTTYTGVNPADTLPAIDTTKASPDTASKCKVGPIASSDASQKENTRRFLMARYPGKENVPKAKTKAMA